MAIFYNRATLIHGGQITSSNQTVGEVRSSLAITKTALYGEYTRGSLISYLVTVTNNGTEDITNLSLNDDLGAYDFGTETLVPLEYIDGTLLYFINGAPAPAPDVTAGPPLQFEGIIIPAGAVAQFIYTVRANEFAPLEVGAEITNTVSSGSDAGGCELVAAETVTAAESVELTIAKFICPDTVTCGSEVTYTFVIQNSGNTEAVATDNVIVRDVFDPAINISEVLLNGTPLEVGTGYTYNELTGEFATVEGAVTVPAATFERDPETAAFTVTPGVTTLTVTGTL